MAAKTSKSTTPPRRRTEKVRAKINGLLGVRYSCAADGTESRTRSEFDQHLLDEHQRPQPERPARTGRSTR